MLYFCNKLGDGLVLIVNFILALVGAALVSILVIQYRRTGMIDYLLFSGAFISLLLEELIIIFFDITNDSFYESDMSETIFLSLQKTIYIFGTLGWLFMFIIAYRTRRESYDSLFYGFILYYFAIAVLILSMSLNSIPLTVEGFGVSFNSTLDQNGPGAALIINDIVIFGQGYELVMFVFRLSCSSFVLYSFLTLENEYNYDKFDRVKLIWIISMSTYSASQLFQIFEAFQANTLFEGLIVILLMIAALSLLLITLLYPEGLLLSRVQILRVAAIYDDKKEELQASGIVPLQKTKTYVDFVIDQLKAGEDKNDNKKDI